MNRKQKCCLVCSPRAGTSILLWWTMVCCVVGMYLVNYKLASLRQQMGQEWDWLFQNFLLRCFIINLLIIVAVVCVVGLYGVYMKNPRLLMPYIVYRTVADILIVSGLFPVLLDAYLNPGKYGHFIKQIIKPYSIEKDNAQDYFDHIFFLFIVLEFLFMAVEVHFIKVILSCYDLTESAGKKCKNEVLSVSNLKGSSPNGIFYFTPEKEISTAV